MITRPFRYVRGSFLKLVQGQQTATFPPPHDAQPSEPWLEVPHPGTRFRLKLHDGPFASKTTPFARERDRRRPIRWQAVKNSYSGNHSLAQAAGLPATRTATG